MAQPSSSHHDRDREREHRHRSERERHHHHRTISSTTLLLVLSLVLAVLAVMLSLPSSSSAAGKEDPASSGLWGYLTPKRSQVLVARESSVASREAEVARREAELLVGAPGGVLPTQAPCPPCPSFSSQTIEYAPAQTIIKEVVKEADLAPPGWWKEAGIRSEEVLDRELRVGEREREITRREESVNRREHDASRRESWIMEQLIIIGNDSPTVEEEYIYEPTSPKRKFKELPPLVVAETEFRTVTFTQTMPAETVTVPPPANTRFAAFPTPQVVSVSMSTAIPRTTSVDIIIEEETFGGPNEEEYEYEEEEEVEVDGIPTSRRVVRNGRQARRPQPRGWFGGW